MSDMAGPFFGKDTNTSSLGSTAGRFVVRHMTRWRLSFAIQFIEFIVIVAIGLIDHALCSGGEVVVPSVYLSLSVMVAVVAHFSFARVSLYEVESLFDEIAALRAVLARWTVIFLGLAAFAALAHVENEVSRLWFVGFYFAGLGGLLVNRTGFALIVRRAVRRGYVTRSLVVYGDNELAGSMAARLANNRSGVRVVAVFDDVDETTGATGPHLGGLSDLLEFTKHQPVDMVVICLPLSESERIEATIRGLRHQPLNIRVLPGKLGIDRMSAIRSERTELPGIQLIEVANRPISNLGLFAKEAFDRLIAFVALLILAPVFCLIALAITFSSAGPIFFLQPRVGYNGKIFRIYKFRTMHPDRCGHERPTVLGDARVFKVGGVLRRLSLDELPQLINVLRGEMSLVGPRPHMLGQRLENATLFEEVNDYIARYRVKPGITGWAQVNGWRGPAHTMHQIQARIRHDIYYIENWSMWLDIYILCKTVLVAFVGRNAY
jgi:Undecaprenyl-phosphate glucose phosphotransferase